MLQRVSKTLLLILSGWLLTGPLALMQVGAWGWMLANYSQESSFQQAIVETFGDERPCDVCRMIDVLEETESTRGTTQLNEHKEIKLMLGLGRAIRVSVPTGTYVPKAHHVCEPENALSAVPTPPPRAA